MQFKTLLLAASSLVAFANAASIQNFLQFYAESDNEEINGQGLASIHAGAAYNLFFLGSEAQTLDYDTKSGVISYSIKAADGDPIELDFGVDVNAPFPSLNLFANNNKNTKWTIEDGYLKGNNSENFVVAKNTGDPYRYSETRYQVALFPEGASTSEFDDAQSIKIKVTQSATL